MTTYRGYLELPYLTTWYLGGYVDYTLGSQVDMKISDQKILGNQVEQKISDLMPIGSQVLKKIYELDGLGSQITLFIDSDLDDFKLGSQADLKIYETKMIGNQVVQKIYDAYLLGSQVLAKKESVLDLLGSQVDLKLYGKTQLGESAKLGKLLHTVWERWLTGPYLEETYLAPGFHAWQGSQVEQKLYHPHKLGSQVFLNVYEVRNEGSQVNQKIYDVKDLGSQVLQKLYHPNNLGSQVDQKIYTMLSLPSQVSMKIYDSRSMGSQVTKIKISRVGSQVNLVVYNITQFRILQTFVSRGTPALGGANWMSNVPMKVGDYGINNVNTDIIEQRAETAAVPGQWIITCNTGIPQGAFVDTVAILNHNFTKAARIELQASDDPLFGTVGFSTVLTNELVNTYWIAPSLPTESFIYWRFLIDDVANPNSGLSIGTIVFGSSQMFSVWENFDNPIGFGHKHFKDSIDTEGYTAVSNDRATRKHLSLTFNDIKYDAGNYRMIRDYFLNNKTDLKCLIIPRPTKASAFAVFSKLAQMPSENHNAISDTEHWVSFTMDWDEAL